MKITHKSNSVIEFYNADTVAAITSNCNCVEFINEGTAAIDIYVVGQANPINLPQGSSYKFGGRESTSIILTDTYNIIFVGGVTKKVKVVKEIITAL